MKKNVFEQFDSKDVKEIEKAQIFGALKNYNNPMMFEKTGAELKEQIKNVILPILMEANTSKVQFITAFLEAAPTQPTENLYCKIDLGDEFPFKVYNWEQCHYREKGVEGQIFKGFGDIEPDCEECCGDNCDVTISTPIYCASEDEAKSRQTYNSWVEDLRDIILDIRTANVLLNNLIDTQKYILTLDQVTALKF